MNLHEVTELAKRGESEQVEFKSTTGQRSEAMRTVCAMLNGLGGFVVFGITPEGKVLGQTVATSTLKAKMGAKMVSLHLSGSCHAAGETVPVPDAGSHAFAEG